MSCTPGVTVLMYTQVSSMSGVLGLGHRGRHYSWLATTFFAYTFILAVVYVATQGEGSIYYQ